MNNKSRTRAFAVVVLGLLLSAGAMPALAQSTAAPPASSGPAKTMTHKHKHTAHARHKKNKNTQPAVTSGSGAAQ